MYIEHYGMVHRNKFHYEMVFTVGGVHYRRFHCTKKRGGK